jgi:clan AA aspartic protease (TIGR02281 family)
MKLLITLYMLAALFIAAPLSADTVYLKNGGEVEGVVEKENERSVEINMGFGTIAFHRSQIKNIKRSSTEDSARMAKNWDEKRIELKKREGEFEEARDRRLREFYENSVADAKAKKLKEEGAPKSIQMAWDARTKSAIVEVMLNEKVKANLILDTGASLVVLSRKIGDSLGLDLTDTQKDIIEMRLADGRKMRGRVVILDSVRIQDIEVKKVMAAVMLDQLPDPGQKDGLLGMTFLNKFNLKIDLKEMKMSLEKLDKVENRDE